MKQFSISLTFLSLLILLSSCGNKAANSQPGQAEIRIGFMPGSSPIIIGRAKGWFDQEFTKQGIKVSFYQCSYGPPMVEAFIADKIDVGLMGDQPAIVGFAQGVEYKAVASFAVGYNFDGLLVSPESNIKTIKDLKGKKISVPVGSVLQHLLHLYLKQAGLTEKDVQIVNLTTSEGFIALTSKHIDAIVSEEPYLQLGEFNKVGKIIAFADGLKYFTSPLLVTNAFSDKHPDLVKKAVSLYAKAQRWAKEHPEEAADIVTKEFKLPKDVLISVIRKSHVSINLDSATVKANQATLAYLQETKVVRNQPNLNEFYAPQYLKELKLQ